MNKKIIIGKELQQEEEDTRSWVQRNLAMALEFYEQDKIKIDWNETIYIRNNSVPYVMQPNHFYYQNAVNDLLVPRNIIKRKIEFDDISSWRRTRKFYCVKSNKGEHCIVFKMNSQSRWQAVFYMYSKSIVLASRAEIGFITKVLGWLEENGFLVRLSVVIPTVNTASRQIMEIHNGVAEVVDCPPITTYCTVGTDPEFEVVRNGSVVYPPNYYHGTSVDQEIGKDGAGSQIELRPKAGSPEQVVHNLKSLMLKLKDPISVIGHRFPLGGHIHIGVKNRKAYPTPELLWLLDYFVGKQTVELSGQARSGYKKLGAYETKPWGFEYRTPSAAIFANPDFAELAMKACLSVTEKYVNKQVFKVTMNEPVFEDYLNYCDFCEKDYDNWIRNINEYKAMMVDPAIYEFNFASNWGVGINEGTHFGCNCENIERNGRCRNRECPICYPDTWRRRERLNARISAQNSRLSEISRITETLAGKNVYISDEWSAEALEILLREFANANVSRFNSIVTLFGLRESRGLVTYNYDLADYGRIANGEITAVDSHSYGVARVVRVYFRDNDLSVLVNIVNQIIANEEFEPIREGN